MNLNNGNKFPGFPGDFPGNSRVIPGHFFQRSLLYVQEHALQNPDISL